MIAEFIHMRSAKFIVLQEWHKAVTPSHTVSLRWQDLRWGFYGKMGIRFLRYPSSETAEEQYTLY